MSATASYFKLGLFVIIGTLLIVAAVVVLGAGAFLKEYNYFETYIDNSAQGLSVGSPCKYRGVQIGSVDRIGFCSRVYAKPDEGFESEYSRYVYIRVAVEQNPEDKRKPEQIKNDLAKWISQGMRLRLASEGITGLAYLEADFLDPEQFPPLKFDWTPKDLYIPSAPSTMAQVSESLVSTLRSIQGVDFAQLGTNVNELVVTVDRAVKDLKVGAVTEDVQAVLVEARSALRRVNEIIDQPEMDTVGKDMGAAITDIRKAAHDLEPAIQNISAKFGTMADSIAELTKNADDILTGEDVQKTLDELPALVTQLRGTVQRVNQIVASEQQNVHSIVENLGIVMSNLESFTADAKQYPSRVLFGEPPRPAALKAED